ncbi:MAG: type II toxin-antitoxin system HicB family antitoxin [Chloroflexota bacterium]
MTTKTTKRLTPDASTESTLRPHAPHTPHAPDAPVDPEIGRQVEEIMKRRYRMVIQGDPEEGYLAEVPELPGCSTAGETPEEALELLRDAMAGWLVVTLEHGQAIPEPAPMSYELPTDGETSLRLPEDLHHRLAERARDEGVSLNQMAVTLLTQGLASANSKA